MKEFSLIYIFVLGVIFNCYTQNGYILKAVDSKQPIYKSNTTVIYNTVKYNNKPSKIKNDNSPVYFMINSWNVSGNASGKGVRNDPSMMIRRRNSMRDLNTVKWIKY